MSLAACPRCADQVAVPLGASRQATVRCPLCQEEFPLAEVLDRLPPALIVVSDPGAGAEAAVPRPLGEVPEVVSVGLASPETWSPPAFAVDRGPATTAGPAAPARRKVAPRPRKKHNPVAELVKVVLGGVAGLVLAQLLLWWMPFEKYRRDPFKMGPKVSQLAPWIVPEKFQGQKTPAASEPGAAETLAPTPGFPPGQANLSDSGLPQRDGFVDPNQAAEPKKKAGKPAPKKPSPPAKAAATKPQDDAAEEEPPLAAAPPPGAAPNDIGPIGVSLDPGLMQAEPKPPAAPKPSAEDAPAAAQPTTAARIPSAPKTSAGELKSALDDAHTALKAWQGAGKTDLKAAAQCFRMFAKWAEAQTCADSAAEDSATAAKDLLQAIAGEEEKLALIAKVAAAWIPSAKRDSNGVLLAGVVRGVKQQGELYETALDLIDADGTALTLVSEADPRPQFSTGAKILAAGLVVRDPAQEIKGYDGQAETVVWLGPSHLLAAP